MVTCSTGTYADLMTRWLDDDEKAVWRLYLSATRLVEDALDQQLRRDADIPHSYYEILVRLSASPDRSMRMSELADVTLSSRSRLSHAVGRLEALGWIERQECPTDRRGQVAVLTEVGFDALAAAAPGHVEEARRRLFDPLTPDQIRQLGEISRALLVGLGEDPEAIAGLAD